MSVETVMLIVQQLEPNEMHHSLHVTEEVYFIGEDTIRLFYEIGGDYTNPLIKFNDSYLN